MGKLATPPNPIRTMCELSTHTHTHTHTHPCGLDLALFHHAPSSAHYMVLSLQVDYKEIVPEVELSPMRGA